MLYHKGEEKKGSGIKRRILVRTILRKKANKVKREEA